MMNYLMSFLVKKKFQPLLLFSLITFVSHPTFAEGKKRTIRKVQEVNFGEMSLKGTIRNPDGAYLVQKRGIKFLPLYDVKKDLDSRIRDTSYSIK
jgi:hypothetical protein